VICLSALQTGILEGLPVRMMFRCVMSPSQFITVSSGVSVKVTSGMTLVQNRQRIAAQRRRFTALDETFLRDSGGDKT